MTMRSLILATSFLLLLFVPAGARPMATPPPSGPTERIPNAWIHTYYNWNSNQFTPAGSQICYRKKSSTGWSATSVLLGTATSGIRYQDLRLKVGTDGAVSIVAVLRDYSVIAPQGFA